MTRMLSIMLAMALCLPMVACEPSLTGPAEEPPVQQDPPPPPYTFVVENTADKYSDTDGTMLAVYNYDILRMQTSESAGEDVAAVLDLKVMNGTAAGHFDPLGTYTREQAVLTLLRLYANAPVSRGKGNIPKV